MGEIYKQDQAGDRPEAGRPDEEQVSRRLRIKLRQVDFVSPLGAFRASEGSNELTLAPNGAEIWRDWRRDLDRRLARTALETARLLAEHQKISA